MFQVLVTHRENGTGWAGELLTDNIAGDSKRAKRAVVMFFRTGCPVSACSRREHVADTTSNFMKVYTDSLAVSGMY